MTGPEDFREQLDDLEAELARFNIKQIADQPQLEQLLTSMRKVIADFQTWQRGQESEARLSDFLDAMGKNTASFLSAINENTANTYDRLTASEERLEQLEKMLLDRAGPTFERKDEIEAEGEWLKAELAGPPSASANNPYFKDAPRFQRSSSIDVLASALINASSAAKTKQKAP